MKRRRINRVDRAMHPYPRVHRWAPWVAGALTLVATAWWHWKHP